MGTILTIREERIIEHEFNIMEALCENTIANISDRLGEFSYLEDITDYLGELDFAIEFKSHDAESSIFELFDTKYTNTKYETTVTQLA
jgi:hypothetical protein